MMHAQILECDCPCINSSSSNSKPDIKYQLITTFLLGIIIGWWTISSSSKLQQHIYRLKCTIHNAIYYYSVRWCWPIVSRQQEWNNTSDSKILGPQQRFLDTEDGVKLEGNGKKQSNRYNGDNGDENDDDDDDDDDDKYQVLQHAISLFTKQFFDNDPCHPSSPRQQQQHQQKQQQQQSNMKHSDSSFWKRKEVKSNDKVVTYLSPREMVNKLFYSKSNHHCQHQYSMSLDDDDDDNNAVTPTAGKISSKHMNHLFQQIQNYSVQTSHPFFFNQLFGALDPIALAAEIIALGLHTSAYTWETAPVFTLIEREVMMNLGKLVFGSSRSSRSSKEDEKDNSETVTASASGPFSSEKKNSDYDALIDNEYDGLMLPGGSLSNLTAMHIARHFYLYGTETISQTQKTMNDNNEEEEDSAFDFSVTEEKKEQFCISDKSYKAESKSQLIAFVSSEAHYSFVKAASVTGIGTENLVSVPTLRNGQMDVDQLDILLSGFNNNDMCNTTDSSDSNRLPFFVAATSGSTVRGSFDNIDDIVKVCRKHEDRLNGSMFMDRRHSKRNRCKIWVHVDGAWGGSAIFSSRADMRQLMNGIEHVDSFTFNPHKLMGAPQQTTAFISRQKGILKAANSSGAKYLFDSRKNGAECDLGDSSYTCGRRTDAIKLWAQWKYYGREGIGKQMERKADSMSLFARMIRDHESFMLACPPCPFNVNFFYLPKRIRKKLKDIGIDTISEDTTIPDGISHELATVSVQLKLKLHESGEMLIPYQPLSNQKADCFRLVLAGNKVFNEDEYKKVILIMDKYGRHL